MPIDDITRKVSERYAHATSTGEQICCPTGYNHDDLRSFIRKRLLRISYGCGTPAGPATVRSGETVWISCQAATARLGMLFWRRSDYNLLNVALIVGITSPGRICPGKIGQPR